MNAEGPFSFRRYELALDRLDNAELELAHSTCHVARMAAVNVSLVEALRAGSWFVGSGVGSGAIMGFAFTLLGDGRASLPELAALVAVLGLAAIGLAGGRWHARRARELLLAAEPYAEAARATEAEMRKRGLL